MRTSGVVYSDRLRGALLAFPLPGTGNRPPVLIGCHMAKIRFQKKIDPGETPLHDSLW